MIFNSVDYILFLGVVATIYYIIPSKGKNMWLLIAGIVFYTTWNPYYLIIIGICIFTSFIFAILIEKYDKERYLQRYFLWISIIICIGNLIGLKYADFLIDNANHLLKNIGQGYHIDTFELLVPVGISFYVLQAVGYVIDVYKGKVKAEKNILDYSLFLCFFPQLCSGPIARANRLLPQIKKKDRHINPSLIENGIISFGYGLFLKVVLADNINLIVSPIFDIYEDCNGMQLLMASILFGIQIYCDFAGYSLMAIGSAEILGIELMTNFKQPYINTDIKSFWRNWHISLTSWFTDYLYIPLGGNRKGKLRKYLNVFIVFLCSGLWHGAAWHFVAWGALNGLFLIFEESTQKISKRLLSYLKIDVSRIAWKIFKGVFVFLCIDFTWIFFKASSLKAAINIIAVIAKDFRPGWFLTEACIDVFGTDIQFAVILFSTAIMLFIDYWNKLRGNVKELLFRQQIVYRWIIYFALIYVILCWGAFGEGYEQTQFIYFGF